MAYALDYRSQGAIAHASVPAWSTTASSVWSIEFEIEVFALSSTIALGGATYAARVAQITTAGTVTCQNSGGGTVLTSAAGAVTVGINTIKVERTSGGLWQLTVNGVSVSTTSTAACAPMTYLANRVQNSYTSTNIAIRRVTTSGGAYSASWDGTNAPSTGTTWTSSGGQVATLNNFTGTTNSWWVFYDAGGATTATISYDIGNIDFAVSASVSAPGVSASVGYDIGEIVYAVSASSSVPVVDASIAYDIGAIEFSVSASAFAPDTIATVSYDIGAVEFSVSASSSVPVFQSEIAYDIGAVEFNIQAAATAAGNFATIAYDIGAIDFNVSADSSVPVVSATASYDIGEVSFSIAAAASAPGSAATVSFDIGEIVFAVSASATGPVPQDISATIGYDIGAISFSVSATVTGIGPGSGVGYGVQFTEPPRGFTFTEPPRGVQF